MHLLLTEDKHTAESLIHVHVNFAGCAAFASQLNATIRTNAWQGEAEDEEDSALLLHSYIK